jgi:hypothetical protein
MLKIYQIPYSKYSYCFKLYGTSKKLSIVREAITLKFMLSEPKFVNLLGSPGIDFQPGRRVRQPYLLYRPPRPHSMAESIPRNRFIGSINVYKSAYLNNSHLACLKFSLYPPTPFYFPPSGCHTKIFPTSFVVVDIPFCGVD